MENIHLKTTIALIYIAGFIAFSLLSLWLMEKYELKISGWLCLLFGFSGIALSKELFDNMILIGDGDNALKRLIAISLGIILGVIFIIFWLATYVILAPVYFLYFIGFILGKGMEAAKK